MSIGREHDRLYRPDEEEYNKNEAYLRPELPAQEDTPVEERNDHLDAVSAMGTRPEGQTHERRRCPDGICCFGIVLDALEIPEAHISR